MTVPWQNKCTVLLALLALGIVAVRPAVAHIPRRKLHHRADAAFHAVRRWNAVDLVGVALPAARVMVNGRLAQRDGTRFVFPLPLTDVTPAHLTNLTVTAALDDGNAEQYATRTVLARSTGWWQSLRTT